MFLDPYYLVFTLMQGLGDYNLLNLIYLAKLFGLQLHLQAHSELRAFPSTVRIACVADGISRVSAFVVMAALPPLARSRIPPATQATVRRPGKGKKAMNERTAARHVDLVEHSVPHKGEFIIINRCFLPSVF